MSGDSPITCAEAQPAISLFVYGELPDRECHALELHLTACAQCRRELESAQALLSAMSILPVEEPSPNLLAQTRLRLEEALDAMPPAGWLDRLRRSLLTEVRLLRSAPLAAAAMLLAGVSVGSVAHFQRTHPEPLATAGLPANGAPVRIVGVSSVAQEPESGMVKVEYSRAVPEMAVGLPSDPAIRQLLVVGAGNRSDPAVQGRAIALLSNACNDGSECSSDDAIRNAFMVALRYDASPEVRRKALLGLKPFVGEDTHVRDVVLESVLDDTDPAVRSQAISMLQPVEADSSVRQVLHTVAAQDGNPHLRTVSREVLDQLPQIQ